ncbi:hypothetical protein D9611_012094 [Ephemerocybe angulata]|uniref:Uncharacterized protein n=1 Tax=Ephemerocybe angulata TaxID=980116 RepID=A0A8H5ES52_9AGAR|nr:hypothetical protein D9611_012094 [Tulosesus angulatus]
MSTQAVRSVADVAVFWVSCAALQPAHLGPLVLKLYEARTHSTGSCTPYLVSGFAVIDCRESSLNVAVPYQLGESHWSCTPSPAMGFVLVHDLAVVLKPRNARYQSGSECWNNGLVYFLAHDAQFFALFQHPVTRLAKDGFSSMGDSGPHPSSSSCPSARALPDD